MYQFNFWHEECPALCKAPARRYNYLVGAVLLGLNLLSGVALHVRTRGLLARAMAAYVGPLAWFVLEYLWFEHVHTYTYDIFRERVGFKMVLRVQ